MYGYYDIVTSIIIVVLVITGLGLVSWSLISEIYKSMFCIMLAK